MLGLGEVLKKPSPDATQKELKEDVPKDKERRNKGRCNSERIESEPGRVGRKRERLMQLKKN
jgi:hypothetical protein